MGQTAKHVSRNLLHNHRRGLNIDDIWEERDLPRAFSRTEFGMSFLRGKRAPYKLRT